MKFKVIRGGKKERQKPLVWFKNNMKFYLGIFKATTPEYPEPPPPPPA